jgi:protein SCO1/2
MKLLKLNRYNLLIFLAFTIIGCKKSEKEVESRVETLPYYNEASFTPKWLNNVEDLETFHKVPFFNLIDQNGESVTEQTFKEKIYVTDFFFTTCPGICPKMTENMALVQEAFKDDPEVLLLSHSVTPETDSVQVLKTYAENKGAISNKWYLVTGDRKQIYDLGRKTYFVEQDLGQEKEEDEFLHSENFVLIDKNKHIRGIYNGLNATAVQQLIADIKTLEKEN